MQYYLICVDKQLSIKNCLKKPENVPREHEIKDQEKNDVDGIFVVKPASQVSDARTKAKKIKSNLFTNWKLSFHAPWDDNNTLV